MTDPIKPATRRYVERLRASVNADRESFYSSEHILKIITTLESWEMVIREMVGEDCHCRFCHQFRKLMEQYNA